MTHKDNYEDKVWEKITEDIANVVMTHKLV